MAARKVELPHPQEMIDPAADWHLKNWARWMRNYEVGIGFKHRSVALVGYGSDTFDDMLEEKDRWDAKIANAVIGSMDMIHQAAIHNVYLADVWRFRGDPITIFLEAADLFWKMGQRRGLT